MKQLKIQERPRTNITSYTDHGHPPGSLFTRPSLAGGGGGFGGEQLVVPGGGRGGVNIHGPALPFLPVNRITDTSENITFPHDVIAQNLSKQIPRITGPLSKLTYRKCPKLHNRKSHIPQLRVEVTTEEGYREMCL